jgi:putative tryptophan/tyrosine transport system substrate-binding protein
MRRRQFLGLIGGAVAAPRFAKAQQGDRVRRIALLLTAPPDDSEYPTLVRAFLDRLAELGWSEGRNLKVDVRWGGAGPETMQRNATELVALSPEVILAPGSSAAGPVLRATRTVPVIFTIVPDPVGAGFVDNLARPGGNATGFTSFDYDIGGKWLALLREAAPGVKRLGILRDPDITAGIGQWSAIQAVAPILGLEATPINVRDPGDLQQALAGFARAPHGGLVITSGASPVRHRDLIVGLAAEHRLPAIYYARAFVTRGGLISYGADRVDQFRRAAGYVHRILEGEKPADLPVQAPTRYELVVNLKAAKALGLAMPQSLLARADEIIE